jgi:hypothetical protein
MKRSAIEGCVRLAISLALTIGLLGCGQMESSGVQSDSENLSVAKSSASDPACGRVLDPKKDRDHAFHKRCERYQQKRQRHGLKDGNAQVTTRALMDVTRTTELEVTTGTFDDGTTPPGKLDELRISLARTNTKRDDGKALTIKGTPGGYVRVPLPGAVHGQSMSISARVSGIDKRVDQVDLQDQVNYRPDLSVGTLDVSDAPTPGAPTPIAATIREMMGDEGATGDCVLSVDGAVVDRAPRIWVDSGGLVTCHFVHAFEAGSHRVAVDVNNVVPRDYDASNNHSEIVVTAAQQFAYSGSVYDSTYAGEDVEDVVDQSSAILYHRDDTWTGVDQSVSLTGTWPSAISFPLASISVSASSQGATWPLFSLGALAADPADGSGSTCASANDASGYTWVGVCTTTVGGVAATQLSVSTFAGDVTYHSEGVCKTTTSFYDCAGGYTWNSGSDSPAGTRHPLADSVSLSLAVDDSAGVQLRATPVIAVAPFTSSTNVPRTCDPQPDGTSHCYSHSYAESGVSGSTP